jgi:6-phosphogluconolactonase (cycloisomerase 2 family)
MGIIKSLVSRLALPALCLSAISACGGGGYGGSNAAPASYNVGGTVSGLAGTGMVLQNNTGNDLNVTANGAFTFTTMIASGSAYAVTVKTQPGGPTQNCVVASGSGSVGSGNVTNVAVTCTTSSFTVGGTVTGLTGTGLVLQNNAGNDLAVAASGAFTFTTAVASGAAYAVTVKTQPTAQSCTVATGSGTIGAANLTTVAVTCTAIATFTVGGTISGLTGSGLVLQNNAANDLSVSANGTFAFSTALAGGAAYAVTVKTQPSTPSQTCAVASGAGTVAAANVTNVAVTCVVAAGRFAYATNNGSNNISVYSINATSGALTALASSPVAAGSSPYGIAVSPNGKFLAAGNEGSANVSVYSINAATGVLTQVSGSPFTVGTTPEALTFDLTSAYLYVANRDSNNISAFAVNATTGVLTALAGSPVTIASGTLPESIAVDPTGKFVITANGGSDNMSVFSINAGAGTLTAVAGSPFALPAGAGPLGLTFGAAGKFVYTLISTGVGGFSLNATTGALTALSSPSFAITPSNYLSADHAGAYLYAPGTNNVSGYAVNATTGALTLVAGSPYAAGSNAYSVAIDPSNKFLYVANDNAASISGFTINAASGALTSMGTAFAAGSFPDFIAIF